jgi:hypothetical protein
MGWKPGLDHAARRGAANFELKVAGVVHASQHLCIEDARHATAEPLGLIEGHVSVPREFFSRRASKSVQLAKGATREPVKL